jgi:hypothetical protein
MRKSCSFHEFYDLDWPSPDELKKYFSAGGKLWASRGNDNWALRAEGLYGTAVLPRPDAVNVDLRMMGSPGHGVTLEFREMAWSDSALGPLLLQWRSKPVGAIHVQPAGRPVFARIARA